MPTKHKIATIIFLSLIIITTLVINFNSHR